MKKVLITGTSRGIGKAAAGKLLGEGWHVLGTSTSDKKTITHPRYEHFVLNLSDTESIISCAEKIKSKHDQIDALIDCAGVSYEPDENQIDMEILRRVLEVNLFGTIKFTEAILPVIRPSGHIVIISSMMSSLVNFTSGECPAYRISKTALNMYVKTLSVRLPEISVSAFDPGWVKTDMGGADAPREPEIPAAELFRLVTTPHPTGCFWFKGHIRSW